MAPQNIPSAIVLTLGNKVVLYSVDWDIGGLRPQCVVLSNVSKAEDEAVVGYDTRLT